MQAESGQLLTSLIFLILSVQLCFFRPLFDNNNNNNNNINFICKVLFKYSKTLYN